MIALHRQPKDTSIVQAGFSALHVHMCTILQPFAAINVMYCTHLGALLVDKLLVYCVCVCVCVACTCHRFQPGSAALTSVTVPNSLVAGSTL
jgi:hypothetical protein